MVTLPSWRRAYGALKDRTKVGLAHVTSDFKDVDVAIVKATNHVECPPKERHLTKILVATSSFRPRADVAYCIHALARRLAKTRNWTVALKTLIVFHRLLREGDPTFREELLNFQQTGRILHVSNFKDDSSPKAWDCSAWVRMYALFLEERLECFGMLKYDIEAEGLPRPTQGQDKSSQRFSRTRELGNDELLEQLPALQQLLHCLMGCRPEGAASSNSVIQYALALVLKESFKIYLAINDGIINLVDKFFEMTRHEAIKSVDIYKKAGEQAISLSEFYDMCKGLELARNFQFPSLKEPPRSFIVTMEEYIREAPSMVTAPMVALEYPERLMLTYKQEDDIPISSEEITASLEESEPPPTAEVVTSTPEEIIPPPPPTNVNIDDLLGLNSMAQDASVIEESNASALAIVPSGFATVDSSSSEAKGFDPTSWELALVLQPSTGLSSSVPQERQLAGGLDSLTLNSLYDQHTYNPMQQPLYRANYTTFTPIPLTANGAFSMPTNSSVPTFPASMAQPSFNSFYPLQPAYPLAQPQPLHQQQHYFPVGSQNPFVNTGFRAYPPPTAAVATQPQTSNPFDLGV